MNTVSKPCTGLARLLLIVSMAIFGTIGIFVKYIDLSSAEIALCRAAIASVVLFFVLLATGRLPIVAALRRKLLWLFMSGAAMGFNWILLFSAYDYISIAMATLCYYFSPTLVILGCVLLFREKLTPWQLLCFVASTVGVVLMIGLGGGGSNTVTGAAMGLGAALLYATVVLLNKRCGAVDGLVRTWIQFVSAVIVLLPYVLMTGGLHPDALSSSGIVNLLVLGLMHTSLTYVLYFAGLSHLQGQEAAILSYIDPAVAVMISMFVLREPTTVWQLIGGGIVIVFALLNELPTSKQRRQS